MTFRGVTQVLLAWSEVFRSPVTTGLTPGRVWEVAADHGHRYILKKVSTFDAPDPVRRFTDEARILTYLLQQGIPVAVPVLSNGGRPYATDEDGAPHAVFPLLPGEETDDGLDPVRYRNIGAAIARPHVALAACPFGVESWEVGPRQLTATWQAVRDGLPPDVLARVEPRWDWMVRAVSVPHQRVHGDVHGGNLLTVGQEVTGIIDCDHLPLAPRGHDVGYYLVFAVHWWAGRRPTHPSGRRAPAAAGRL